MILPTERLRPTRSTVCLVFWVLTTITLLACSNSEDQDPDIAMVDVTMDTFPRDTRVTQDLDARADMRVDGVDDIATETTDPLTPDAARDTFDTIPDQELDSAVDMVDLPVVTYTQDVQPILRVRCSSCHSAQSQNGLGISLFVDDYAETQQPSGLRPGESVGTCIGLAVAEQAMEGTRCRTYGQPFHREGWICLTEAERAVIANWVDGGLME